MTNRVFTLSEIENLRVAYENFFNEAIQISQNFTDIQSKALSLQGQVPGSAQSSLLASAASAEYTTAEFEQMRDELNNTLNKLSEAVPAADSELASQLVSLGEVAGILVEISNTFLSVLKQGIADYTPAEFIQMFDAIRLGMGEKLDQIDATYQKSANGLQAVHSAYAGDPINVCTGNFTIEKQDITVEGEWPLIFKRTFNSFDHYHGTLGRKWQHCYEEKLTVLDDGRNIRFLLEDSREFTFHQHHDGYHCQTSPFYQLEHNESSYILRDVYGMTYCFSQEGNLLTKTNAKGQVLTYHYDRQGRLMKVSHKSQQLRFRYNLSGLLENVMDNQFNAVNFEYEQGSLVAVKRPNGAVERYQNDWRGNIESIVNPRGITVLKNQYDMMGRVIRQCFPDGNEMSFTYDDKQLITTVVERNGGVTRYQRDEHYRHIGTEDELGHVIIRYNDQNRMTKTIDRNGYVTQYEYNAEGKLAMVKNALNEVIQFDYNKEGHIQTLTQANGAKLHMTYRNNLLVASQDALGNETSYVYNELKQLTEVAYPDGSVESFAYNEEGQMSQLVDAMGAVTSFSYDENGRVSTVVNPLGDVRQYKYDAVGNLITFTNELGLEQSFTYNAINKLETFTDFDGKQETYQYNELGKVQSFCNKEGAVTIYAYDSMWNVSEVTMPNGAVTRYRYDQSNRLIGVINPQGVELNYDYDANGNRKAVHFPDGSETRFEYDALNRCTAVIEADGLITRYVYNILGKVEAVIQPDGTRLTMTYDPLGQLTSRHDDQGKAESIDYTAMGQVSRYTDPTGHSTHYQYYPNGLLREVLDPLGNVTHYKYDALQRLTSAFLNEDLMASYDYDVLGRLTKVWSIDQGERQFQYDINNHLALIQDALGQVTRYEHDSYGHLTRVIDALGHITEYTYDQVGNRVGAMQYGSNPDLSTIQRQRYDYDMLGRTIAHTNSLGLTERYEYDDMGRLQSKQATDGTMTYYSYCPGSQLPMEVRHGDEHIRYHYDELRRLVAVDDWQGTTHYQWNEEGHLAQVQDVNNQRVQYQWDEHGRCTQVMYPSGQEVLYQYDHFNRLVELTQGDAHYHYDYDRLGRLSTKRYADGHELSYHYSPGQRLASLALYQHDSLLMERKYGYNEIGNLVNMEIQTPTQTQSRRYEYDARSQLLATYEQDKLIEQFSYDAFGNRLTALTPEGERSYEYNALNQLLTEQGTDHWVHYQYDARGNRISRQDAEGTTQYDYNWFNQLTTVALPNQETIHYDYNALGQRVGERQVDPDGHTHHLRYVLDALHHRERPLERQSEQVGTETYIWDHSLLANSTGQHFLAGELGNLVAHWDDQGHLEPLDYRSFGETTSQQTFGYTGHGYSATTGLVYAENRYYDPTIGQFLSVDSIKGVASQPQSLNPYTYVWNNPMNLVDLDGKWPIRGLTGGMTGFPTLPGEKAGEVKRPLESVVDILTLKPLNDAWENVIVWSKDKIIGYEHSITIEARRKNQLLGLYQEYDLKGMQKVGGDFIVLKNSDSGERGIGINIPELRFRLPGEFDDYNEYKKKKQNNLNAKLAAEYSQSNSGYDLKIDANMGYNDMSVKGSAKIRVFGTDQFGFYPALAVKKGPLEYGLGFNIAHGSVTGAFIYKKTVAYNPKTGMHAILTSKIGIEGNSRDLELAFATVFLLNNLPATSGVFKPIFDGVFSGQGLAVLASFGLMFLEPSKETKAMYCLE